MGWSLLIFYFDISILLCFPNSGVGLFQYNPNSDLMGCKFLREVVRTALSFGSV